MPFVIDLQLSSPSCGAQHLLDPGQKLRCLGLGGMFGAYGVVEGPATDTVSPFPDDPMGLGVVPGADCGGCPMRYLPRGTRPLAAEVRHEKLQLQILVDDESDVAEALQSLRESGQGPRRVSHQDVAVSSGFTVPWSALTARQREALEAAALAGYFNPGGADVEELARRLGVSRSTAHEHLQKAIAKLLAALFKH